MKSIFRITIGVFMLNSFLGQQDVQFSNFKNYQTFYNPGALINTVDICGNLLARNQWSGFGGQPKSLFFDVSYKINNQNYVGLSILSDQLGQQKNQLIKLGYSRLFSFPGGVVMGLGLNGVWQQTRFGSGYITPDTPVYLDGSIPNAGARDGLLDVELGGYAKFKNIFMGVSCTYLLQQSFQLNSASTAFQYDTKRHYYVVAGYKKQYPNVEWRPAIFMKSDGVSAQIDGQVQAWVLTNFMVGINYRLQDDIDPMIGYRNSIGNWNYSIHYNYGISTNKLAAYSSGTHEFGVRFCYIKPKYNTRYVNPRWLGEY